MVSNSAPAVAIPLELRVLCRLVMNSTKVSKESVPETATPLTVKPALRGRGRWCRPTKSRA